jgi:hypothetical protein
MLGQRRDTGSDESLRVIINHWKKPFTALYKHLWPETYLCVDCEYTGGNAEQDLIVEIGHCIVRRRKIVDRLSVVLDWRNHDVVPNAWLYDKLERCKARMPKLWRWSPEVMEAEGLPANEVLKFYWKLLLSWKKQGLPFVAHNGYAADERMLRGCILGFLNKKFSFGENGLIDTGAVCKATLALDSEDPKIAQRPDIWFPNAADTLRSYFRRVVYAHAKGVHWRLWNCIQYYGLDEEYQLTEEDCHTAGYDAYLTHLLMEKFREYITVSHAEECPFDTPDTLARAFDLEMAKARENAVQTAVDMLELECSDAQDKRQIEQERPRAAFKRSDRKKPQAPPPAVPAKRLRKQRSV